MEQPLRVVTWDVSDVIFSSTDSSSKTKEGANRYK